RFERNGLVELRKEHITKDVIEYYSFLVRKNFVQKFYSHSSNPRSLFPMLLVSFYRNISVGSERNILSLKLSFVAVGFIVTFLSSLLSFFLVLSAFLKVANSPNEIKRLVKDFLWRYIKITLAIFFLFIGFFLGAILLFLLFAKLWAIGMLLFLFSFPFFMLWLFVFCYYRYGVFLIDFITWLFESKEISQHREQWLRFKTFVCNYSALEDKPLKYYELWDEFYYYALAVGAIKQVRFA
ncbi:MAG: hypothetical protein J7L44_01805, partial [Candidatus Diapherotrites archaeon]|nr:hypothetical protein [Candidatus Diapherotrites archaeon]